MTNEELRDALLSEHPIICNGIVYSNVSAIIYRKYKDGIRVQAELLDTNLNSVTIARPDKISLYINEGAEKYAG